MPTSLNRST
jgi:hypothetical protein